MKNVFRSHYANRLFIVALTAGKNVIYRRRFMMTFNTTATAMRFVGKSDMTWPRVDYDGLGQRGHIVDIK